MDPGLSDRPPAEKLDPVPIEKWDVQRKKRDTPEIVLQSDHRESIPGKLSHLRPPQHPERRISAVSGVGSEHPLGRQRSETQTGGSANPQRGRQEHIHSERLPIPVELCGIPRKIELALPHLRRRSFNRKLDGVTRHKIKWRGGSAEAQVEPERPKRPLPGRRVDAVLRRSRKETEV